jgi:hypothetical protein
MPSQHQNRLCNFFFFFFFFLFMVRYLVCVDGSNHAWQAFHIATSLMRHAGVDLLTVVTAIKENDDPDAA